VLPLIIYAVHLAFELVCHTSKEENHGLMQVWSPSTDWAYSQAGGQSLGRDGFLWASNVAANLCLHPQGFSNDFWLPQRYELLAELLWEACSQDLAYARELGRVLTGQQVLAFVPLSRHGVTPTVDRASLPTDVNSDWMGPLKLKTTVAGCVNVQLMSCNGDGLGESVMEALTGGGYRMVDVSAWAK